MSQNLEIEFKNMLTKEEYERLIKTFQFHKSSIYTQENHYFDTAHFDLKEKGSALRIRQKDGKFELTLKQPCKEGLLETNQVLSPAEASKAMTENKLPNGMVKELIEKMGIPFSKIHYFGSLVTERAEVEFKGGLLVFDHSYYLNKEDFEVEYEVENFEHGQQIFLQWLEQHRIPERKTENKIKRFYQQKYLQKSGNESI